MWERQRMPCPRHSTLWLWCGNDNVCHNHDVVYKGFDVAMILERQSVLWLWRRYNGLVVVTSMLLPTHCMSRPRRMMNVYSLLMFLNVWNIRHWGNVTYSWYMACRAQLKVFYPVSIFLITNQMPKNVSWPWPKVISQRSQHRKYAGINSAKTSMNSSALKDLIRLKFELNSFQVQVEQL